MAEASDREMIGFRGFLRFFTGPQLYKRYKSFDEPSRIYSPNFFEAKADTVLSCAGGLKAFCLFTYPVLIPILYYKGYLTAEYGIRLALFATLVYGGSYLVRGLGRMANPDYKTFLTVLDITTRYNTPANKRFLSEFDFEFWAWPRDYNFSGEGMPSQKFLEPQKEEKDESAGMVGRVKDWLASLAANKLGISLLFPGATSMYSLLTKSALIEGRTRIMEVVGGKRWKVGARNGEWVDCVFVDRRNDESFPNGNVLVVTCEGNAGFYEIGSFLVAVDAGYSVLGWNHPGFGGSSGVPWPKNDAAAVEGVIEYATHKLGFLPSDILLFAWSIGGYSATWAAMNFPDVRGLVLDATFDDLVPLAVAKMPPWADGIVRRAVRKHMDLPIARQLREYQGPVTLIRRTRDEIISTQDDNVDAQRKSNRGGNLLKDLLRTRYPGLMTEEAETVVERWLEAENEAERMGLIQEVGVDEEVCVDQLLSALSRQGSGDLSQFPVDIPQDLPKEDRPRLAIFLASRYLNDFHTTHCTPLPPHMLIQPTHPWQILID